MAAQFGLPHLLSGISWLPSPLCSEVPRSAGIFLRLLGFCLHCPLRPECWFSVLAECWNHLGTHKIKCDVHL